MTDQPATMFSAADVEVARQRLNDNRYGGPDDLHDLDREDILEIVQLVLTATWDRIYDEGLAEGRRQATEEHQAVRDAIERTLDQALGTGLGSGAGEGLAADVQLLADRYATARRATEGWERRWNVDEPVEGLLWSEAGVANETSARTALKQSRPESRVVSRLVGPREPAEQPEAAHPERFCHRCHGPNIPWSAPSPLWNAVMRGGSIGCQDEFDGIVCPTCFAVLAQQRGIADLWRFSAERVHAVLATTSPDGRVWNADRWLWVEACEWWPERDGPSVVGQGGCGNPAGVIVGADGTWHLCDSCAALPRFKRMKIKRRAAAEPASGGVVEPSPLTAEEADPITPEVYAEHFPERDDTGKPLTTEEATPDRVVPETVWAPGQSPAEKLASLHRQPHACDRPGCLVDHEHADPPARRQHDPAVPLLPGLLPEADFSAGIGEGGSIRRAERRPKRQHDPGALIEEPDLYEQGEGDDRG